MKRLQNQSVATNMLSCWLQPVTNNKIISNHQQYLIRSSLRVASSSSCISFFVSSRELGRGCSLGLCAVSIRGWPRVVSLSVSSPYSTSEWSSYSTSTTSADTRTQRCHFSKRFTSFQINITDLYIGSRWQWW